MGIGAAIGALVVHLSGGALALYAAMVFYAVGLATLVLTAKSGRASESK
jgi:hypothetical protein